MTDSGSIVLSQTGLKTIGRYGFAVLKSPHSKCECCCNILVPSKLIITRGNSKHHYCGTALVGNIGSRTYTFQAPDDRPYSRVATYFGNDEKTEYRTDGACGTRRYLTGLNTFNDLDIMIGTSAIRVVMAVTRRLDQDIVHCIVAQGMLPIPEGNEEELIYLFKKPEHVTIRGECGDSTSVTLKADENASWYNLPGPFCCLPRYALVTHDIDILDYGCISWRSGSIEVESYNAGGMARARCYHADPRPSEGQCVAYWRGLFPGMNTVVLGWDRPGCRGDPVEVNTYHSFGVEVDVSAVGYGGTIRTRVFCKIRTQSKRIGLFDVEEHTLATGKEFFDGWEWDKQKPIFVPFEDWLEDYYTGSGLYVTLTGIHPRPR